ncbi:abscission/NoCut checkpoint regulator-like [Mizuhopecten yessoensis]|uniref:Zinc finger FYVE domain-containing protein 19 n=1 Tax=Mizuhopecten yessoensis TaxID=6573 RepID=A0A210QEP2_MIZYE|nr:abscission/NoCut checkpoint regulator-like [Mizuhopecten yessoensis]OWF47222.1 Zinc finger FYVE domain-containing protein 19 [Mizuhopecten yessoensis]
MSCYGCGSGFGLFSKEHGCKQCGYAFCGKCLTKKTAIPKLKNEKHHVCNKCFNILTGKIKDSSQENTARFSPPEAYKKRVAALQERESQGNVLSHSKPAGKGQTKAQYKGLTQAERDIAERLDKLKEKPQKLEAAPKATEEEMKARLARLKGQDPSIMAAPTKPTFLAPDRRTQQAQIDDILDEIAAEVEIDSHMPDPVTQVESRLANLKGEGQSGASAGKSSAPGGQQNNLNSSLTESSQPFVQNIASPSGKSSAGKTDDDISVEEMHRLIAEASEEVEADANRALEGLQKDKEIMKKLQDYKGKTKEDINKDNAQGEDNGDSDSDNENEEEVAANLIKRLMEEQKLDEAAGRDNIDVDKIGVRRSLIKSNEERSEEDEDELPYCSICTEDATIRCHGCDKDLYCNQCWNKSHKDFQMEDHVTSKYVAPKGIT